MRVGFDIGGTFTDVTILDDAGRPHTTKVLSLLDRLGEDIAACIERVRAGRAAPAPEPAPAPQPKSERAPAAVSGFVHATTIASNAVIEGTTAPTGQLHRVRCVIHDRATNLLHHHQRAHI